MSQNLSRAISVIGIDIGKNSFHIVGLDERGAIALRQKWSRGQVEARLANLGHVWTAPWQEFSEVSAALVRCGHVSGLLMRREWPLALMLCADRVPIVCMHLEVR